MAVADEKITTLRARVTELEAENECLHASAVIAYEEIGWLTVVFDDAFSAFDGVMEYFRMPSGEYKRMLQDRIGVFLACYRPKICRRVREEE